MFYILLLTVGGFAAQPAMPAIRDYPNVPCIPYATFNTLLEETNGAAKLTQTIETPSFPGLTRLLIVTYSGTKQVFGGRPDCVLATPLFVDHTDSVWPNVPLIDFSHG